MVNDHNYATQELSLKNWENWHNVTNLNFQSIDSYKLIGLTGYTSPRLKSIVKFIFKVFSLKKGAFKMYDRELLGKIILVVVVVVVALVVVAVLSSL